MIVLSRFGQWIQHFAWLAVVDMKWVKIVHIISGAYNLIIKPALLFFCIFLILSAHYMIKGWHYWLGCKFKQRFSGICFKWLCYSSCKYTLPNILVCSSQIPGHLISSFWSIQWRLPDGMPISVLRGHTGAVTAIVFSPRPSAIYQLLSWAPSSELSLPVDSL